MEKRVTILIIIALVLAVAAITLNVMSSSEEVSTTAPSAGQANPTGAQVGVTIEAPTVEDKSGATQ